MVKDYLSFDDFDERDLEKFLKKLPKDFLVIPFTKTKRYRNEVGIKGFRPDSYQLPAIIKIYKKEITLEKMNSFLGRHILLMVDRNIKECLSDEDYSLLSEKKYTPEDLDRIVGSLLEKSIIISKYLLLMLGLDGKQNEKYIIASYEKRISKYKKLLKEQDDKFKEIKNEFDALVKENSTENKSQNKLKKDNEKLTQNYNKIKEENTKLKEKIAELKDDNNRLKEENNSNSEHLSSLSKNDIVDQIFGESKGMNAETINALYKELSFKNFDDYLSVIYEKKKELFNDEDFETINNVILIEYILTKLKEIEKNG